MRVLIPVDFAELGWNEWIWLVLALGGLSLLAPEGPWRKRFAIWIAAIVALFGVVRLLALPEGASAWNRWGPVLFSPALGAALVLFGNWRREGVGWPLFAVLVLYSLIRQPFGRHPWHGLDEWIFLGLLAVPLAVFVHGDSPLRRFLARSRNRWALVALFFGLCLFAQPFGVGWPAALGILFLVWIVYAILEQGPEMRGYVRRRLLGAPVVLFILLLASFVLIRTAPGGPFSREKNVDPALLELQEAQYGYDKPLAVQFGLYMRNLVWSGDLGISTKQRGRTVNEIIARHAGPSVRLGLAAVALALIIGITAGLVAGIRQNSIFDYSSMAAAMLGLALPTFIVGPFLVLAFAMRLDWFAVSGWEDFPRDLILPAITLSLPFAARLARLTRAGMLEIVNQDYIRTARAKGLSEPVIVVRHTLKGTMLPVVSFLGPAIAQLLTGSLVVEKIFQVPGLGREFVESALNRDYELALGLVVLFGTLLIVFNLIVDIAYAFLDPRIRHG